MCGICGEISWDGNVSVSALQAMTASMRTRGPDAEGHQHQQNLGFGHRRLSIIDLAPTSQQPMIDPHLGVGIVFNGCIYNYRELKSELSAKGYQFFSGGDTEVILKAYHAWGPLCVETLKRDVRVCRLGARQRSRCSRARPARHQAFVLGAVAARISIRFDLAGAPGSRGCRYHDRCSCSSPLHELSCSRSQGHDNSKWGQTIASRHADGH